MVKLEGADVVGWNVSCCQRFRYLGHNPTFVCWKDQNELCGLHSLVKNPRYISGFFFVLVVSVVCRTEELGCYLRFATLNSPNPKGCPPIRTIFQSSPEALVKRTLLGNLASKIGCMSAPDVPKYKTADLSKKKKNLILVYKNSSWFSGMTHDWVKAIF